jgi:hypothetical protein
VPSPDAAPGLRGALRPERGEASAIFTERSLRGESRAANDGHDGSWRHVSRKRSARGVAVAAVRPAHPLLLMGGARGEVDGVVLCWRTTPLS